MSYYLSSWHQSRYPESSWIHIVGPLWNWWITTFYYWLGVCGIFQKYIIYIVGEILLNTTKSSKIWQFSKYTRFCKTETWRGNLALQQSLQMETSTLLDKFSKRPTGCFTAPLSRNRNHFTPANSLWIATFLTTKGGHWPPKHARSSPKKREIPTSLNDVSRDVHGFCIANPTCLFPSKTKFPLTFFMALPDFFFFFTFSSSLSCGAQLQVFQIHLEWTFCQLYGPKTTNEPTKNISKIPSMEHVFPHRILLWLRLPPF